MTKVSTLSPSIESVGKITLLAKETKTVIQRAT